MTKYLYATVDGRKIFYREAGSNTCPNILLLHGFPTSSHMFRNLIPALADRYMWSPDLPGFGFSDMPDRKNFRYTFDNLAKVMPASADHRPGPVRTSTFSTTVHRLGFVWP